MGKTTEALMKDHGRVEMTVLHDGLLYRDPDDYATDPREYAYIPATRGQKIVVDGQAAERFESLGSATRTDDQEAKYAKAGMRSPSTLTPPPSASAMFSPESEQVKAVQSAINGGPGSVEQLLSLGAADLRVVAQAFGIDLADDDTKESLAKKIAGRDDDNVDENRERRDVANAVARGDAPDKTATSAEDLAKARSEVGGGQTSGSSRKSSSSRKKTRKSSSQKSATSSASAEVTAPASLDGQ